MLLPLINYFVISDIHLGHDTTTSDMIIDHWKKFLSKYDKYLRKCKVFFINGDIFDKLLVNGSYQHILAQSWLSLVILYCKKNNIKLRILEGTPSHDWKQSQVVYKIVQQLGIEIDMKYIDTVVIEEMQDLGINILYIPDEHKHKAEDTYQEVLELLKEKHLQKVDLTMMHGQFHYQLPMVTVPSSHNERSYLDITEHYIHVGHIHTFSTYERIIANGSFDRLANGEEEDKGGIFATICDNKENDQFIFLINENASIYKTYDYTKITIEEIRERIHKDIKALSKGSNIRILTNGIDNIQKHNKEFKLAYPDYNIKLEKKTEKNKESNDTTLITYNEHDGLAITEDNIVELLHKELKTEEYNSNDLKILTEELNACISSL